MNILITGGAGFIGLNIAENLLRRGSRVVSLGPELPPEAAIRVFEQLPGTFSFESGDVRDANSISDALARYQITHLVHGAAMTAGIQREVLHPALIAEVNLTGTLNVLDAARRAHLKRVVHLSSGAIFGAGGRDPEELCEERDLPQPESLYGITKYAAERAAMRFRQSHGLNVVVARLGVVFGPWEHDTGVRDTLSIPFLLNRFAESGETARLSSCMPDDWVYAPDAARGIASLLDAAFLASPVYHVGSGRRWSIETWCRLLQHRFPGFSYEFSGDPHEINVGASAPSARAPLSIARIGREASFAPSFDEPGSFDHYWAWRAHIADSFGRLSSVF